MSEASATPQPSTATPLAQAKYQVRFDWGLPGAARVAADADVLVWVDVLAGQRAAVHAAVHNDGSSEHAPDAAALHARTGLLASLAAVGSTAAILSAGLTDAAATARWIVELQHRLGRRTMIAVIAGDGDGDGDGADAGADDSAGAAGAGIRFAVENQLAAGAVIDALATLGIDYSSPEAAAACASFTALRGAVGHLLTASASAQELLAQGGDQASIRAAGVLNCVDVATVLRA